MCVIVNLGIVDSIVPKRLVEDQIVIAMVEGCGLQKEVVQELQIQRVYAPVRIEVSAQEVSVTD